MSAVWIGAAVFGLLVAVAFFVLLRRLTARSAEVGADLDWCREFSVAKYRPMERLFAQDDYEFLAAQPGFNPSIYKRLQAERRKIFRHYLRCLGRDFERLQAAAQMLLLHAPQDRPDLAAGLLKQKTMFYFAMAGVRCRLVLQGVGLGTVDVSRLVNALEMMREQLRSLSQRVQMAGVSA